MSVFSDGLKFLGTSLFENAGVNVSISRNGTGLGTYTGVPSKTNYEDLGQDGKRIFVSITDFLFQTSSNYTPQKGDVITLNGVKYEVRALGKELSKVDDIQGTIRRVHAQKIA